MDSGNMRSSFVAPTYDDIAWLQSITKLPVVLKGIMTGLAGLRDARRDGRLGPPRKSLQMMLPIRLGIAVWWLVLFNSSRSKS